MHKDNSLRSKMISLVIPIAFQQLMLALVSASDAVMLGFVNQNAMAAVSLAGQYTFVYGLFMAALTIGCSMFTAQYWGKRDTAMLERILGYVLRFSIIISLCFMIAALLFPTQIMTILTNEVELIRDGSAYLRMVAPSYLLMGISQIY
ncbi:MAG: MATE family efflux transporter, partial [Butyrivibrio sp.]|nr:MATE family efflux transporter [Butyrivibrio sp.]